MNHTTRSRLTTLGSKLDAALTEFQLTPNAQGEYPWQQAQREKKTRRTVAAVGAAGAAGAAAAGGRLLMKKYGGDQNVKLVDGIKNTAVQAGRDVARNAGPAVAKATAAAGDLAKRTGQYVGKVAKPVRQSWGMTGTMKTPWMKRVQKAAAAGVRAVGRTAFADPFTRLVNLEAKLDSALLEFGSKD